MRCIFASAERTIEKLVDKGLIDIDKPLDGNGNVGLDIASACENKGMVTYLLEMGAKVTPEIIEKALKTPGANSEVLQLLRSAVPETVNPSTVVIKIKPTNSPPIPPQPRMFSSSPPPLRLLPPPHQFPPPPPPSRPSEIVLNARDLLVERGRLIGVFAGNGCLEEGEQFMRLCAIIREIQIRPDVPKQFKLSLTDIRNEILTRRNSDPKQPSPPMAPQLRLTSSAPALLSFLQP